MRSNGEKKVLQSLGNEAMLGIGGNFCPAITSNGRRRDDDDKLTHPSHSSVIGSLLSSLLS